MRQYRYPRQYRLKYFSSKKVKPEEIKNETLPLDKCKLFAGYKEEEIKEKDRSWCVIM